MISASAPVSIPLATVNVLELVAAERARQEQLKADGRFRYTAADVEMTDAETFLVLGEEIGEAARACLEKRRLANDVHGKSLKSELVQCAAVLVAWVEKLTKEEADADAARPQLRDAVGNNDDPSSGAARRDC